MSRFADLADCVDPVVTVEEEQLDRADRMTRAVIKNKGIDPDDESISADGRDLLRDLAVALATAAAAAAGATDPGADTVLWRKQSYYQAEAERLAHRVDRESLGLAALGSGGAGYGSISVGRG